MAKTFDFTLNIPPQNTNNAILSMLLDNIAHTRVLQMQIAESICLLKNEGDNQALLLSTLEHYQELTKSTYEDLRVSYLAKFAE